LIGWGAHIDTPCILIGCHWAMLLRLQVPSSNLGVPFYDPCNYWPKYGLMSIMLSYLIGLWKKTKQITFLSQNRGTYLDIYMIT